MPDPSLISGAAAATSTAAPPFWWVQPLVTVLAASAGGIFAWATIRANRHIARIRATLDLIERTESQPYYQELWQAFKLSREHDGGFDALVDANNHLTKEQRAKVLAYLNHYELIAVGCKNGVLDKTFYKNYMRSAFVRDWQKAEGFVNKLRTYPGRENSHAYKYFEFLAREWMSEIDMERRLSSSLNSRTPNRPIP